MNIEYIKSNYNNGIDMVIHPEDIKMIPVRPAEWELFSFALKAYKNYYGVEAGHIFIDDAIKKAGKTGCIVISAVETDNGMKLDWYVEKNGKTTVIVRHTPDGSSKRQ